MGNLELCSLRCQKFNKNNKIIIKKAGGTHQKHTVLLTVLESQLHVFMVHCLSRKCYRKRHHKFFCYGAVLVNLIGIDPMKSIGKMLNMYYVVNWHEKNDWCALNIFVQLYSSIPLQIIINHSRHIVYSQSGGNMMCHCTLHTSYNPCKIVMNNYELDRSNDCWSDQWPAMAKS